MRMRYSFPRQARLTRAKDFEAVYRRGERMNVFPLRVRALRTERAQPDRGEGGAVQSRLGLVVGRKVGGAVERNRWKRAIRETFRFYNHKLPGSYDIVVEVKWESRPEDVERVPQAFLAAVELLNEEERRRTASGAGR